LTKPVLGSPSFLTGLFFCGEGYPKLDKYFLSKIFPYRTKSSPIQFPSLQPYLEQKKKEPTPGLVGITSNVKSLAALGFTAELDFRFIIGISVVGKINPLRL